MKGLGVYGLTAVIVFAFFGPSALAQTASCEDTLIDSSRPTGLCNQWQENRAPILQTFDDGSIVPNPARLREAQASSEIARLEQAPTTSPSQLARTEGSIRSLVESLRLQIREGRSDSELNGHQRYLLNRLDTMRIDFVTGSHDTCADTPINAAYEQVTNTMVVCPLLTYMPPESILALVAHELGHLTDPCNAVDEYRWRGQMASAPSSRLPNVVAANIRSCLRNENPNALNSFVRWSQDHNRIDRRVYPLYAGDSHRTFADRMVACGNAVGVPDERRTPSTYAGHPFLSTISCVTGHFPRAADQPPAKVSAGKTISTSRNLPNVEVVGSDRIASARTPQSCTSMVKETLADHVGANLLRFHLARLPNSVAANRRHLLPYFFETVNCDEHGDATGNYMPSTDRLKLFLSVSQVAQGSRCQLHDTQLTCPMDQAVEAPSLYLTSHPATQSVGGTP